MENETQWSRGYGETESVGVVLHGLNMKPESMNDMVELLQNTNAEVLRLAITGHSDSQSSWNFVQRKHWISDVSRGIEEAAKRATTLGVPLHGVGYSMGGQLLVDALQETGIRTDKNILLAPSIALRPVAQSQLHWAKWLGPLPTPSTLSEEYRSNSTIPGSAYGAMSNSQKAIYETKNPQNLNVPTMIILDPDDEWISEDGLRLFMQKFKLTNWAFRLLKRSKEKIAGRWHHLIHDKKSLAEHWDNISLHIKEFLSVRGTMRSG